MTRDTKLEWQHQVLSGLYEDSGTATYNYTIFCFMCNPDVGGFPLVVGPFMCGFEHAFL